MQVMPVAPSQPAGSLAETWARKLATLHDHSLQVGWLRSELSRLPAARAADVLSVVLARAEQRDERHALLLLRVSLALARPDSTTIKRGIAAVAAAQGQSSLARFLGREQHEAEEERADAGEPEKERELPDFGAGRPLALGERKSLARTHDRNLLARVLRDPDANVIRILLDNPAIVENDVVRLCARRPARAQVLAEVFQHKRWVLHYRVRLTLALNPFTPDEITLQLLPHLTPADLKAVRRSSQISQRVRDACVQKNEEPLH
jgi:hypothetical protein